MSSAKLNSGIYRPILARVTEVREEAPDIKTLALADVDGELPSWRPGQFAMYSVFGEGECPLTIATSPTRGRLECTFRRSGRVTRALYDLDEGDCLGIRGPYGNVFPLDDWKGRDLVFIAGGIGLPALRSSIEYVIDKAADYGRVTILYGAKSAREMIYRAETEEWASRGARVILAVDPGGEDPEWKGEVGLIPRVLERAAPSSANAVALICGPPIMLKFTIPVLTGLGFPLADVYTTLENRMKCGVGKCGRCNVGSVYICKCGPVFSAAEISKMPDDF